MDSVFPTQTSETVSLALNSTFSDTDSLIYQNQGIGNKWNRWKSVRGPGCKEGKKLLKSGNFWHKNKLNSTRLLINAVYLLFFFKMLKDFNTILEQEYWQRGNYQIDQIRKGRRNPKLCGSRTINSFRFESGTCT